MHAAASSLDHRLGDRVITGIRIDVTVL
jgi:hypothetical protein